MAGSARWVVACALWVGCVGDITDRDRSPSAGADAAVGAPDAVAGSPDAAASPAVDAATPAAGLTPQERTLLDIINEERVARGLGAVALREDLTCAARRHSDDIGAIGACTHTGSDGSSPGDRVAGCAGGGWSGEIVACGHQTPRAAVDGWIDSPGHNAIMFSPGQRFVGVAMYQNFWTAIFDD